MDYIDSIGYKLISLMNGGVALVDDEDYERLSIFKWRKEVRHDGSVRAIRSIKSKIY